MEDKDIKKLKRYLEDVVEGRDDLLHITEKLITTATSQVEAVLTSQVEAIPKCEQKEALLKYLTKAVILFSELHNSVFKFIQTEPLPISDNPQTTQTVPKQEHQLIPKSDNSQTTQTVPKEEPQMVQSPPIQDLDDFFKDCRGQSSSTFDFSTSGPKVSNTQVLNDSYFRKPLDNTTLKAICLSKTNIVASTSNSTHGENASKPSLSTVEATTGNSELLPTNNDINNTVAIVEKPSNPISVIEVNSPTYSITSESEVFSAVGSLVYQHPLERFQPSAEIPKRYDTQNLDKIKENLTYLSKKYGFGTDELSKMQHNFSKLSDPIYQYEEPVKEVQSRQDLQAEEVLIDEENHTGLTNTVPLHTEEESVLDSAPTDYNKCEEPQKFYESNMLDGTRVVVNNKISEAGPSTSTGVVRHQMKDTEDLIEFSGSISDSESCGKVSTWLNNNRKSEEKLKKNLLTASNTTLEEAKFKPNSAIDKLHNIKRYDRNEEAREQARKDMPDIKFVPVEVPSVIKNDLISEKKNKKKKIKDLNKDAGVFEMRKMAPPREGAVCIFSHIESPAEFYLQIADDDSMVYLVDEISEKLEAKFKTTRCPFATKREAFLELGRYCFGYVLEEKQSWFRLEVLDWELGSLSPDLEVRAVDFGFRCRTSYTYLRPMTRDLADIPMLATQCHFPFLYPPGSTFSNIIPDWPQQTLEVLSEVANLVEDSYRDQSDFKVFEITIAVLEGDSLAVDLIPFNEAEADSVMKLLVDFEVATELIEDFGDHPEIGEFVEDVDELEQHENLNELVLAYDAKDEMRVCRFTRNDGTCYKGKNCKLEHITLKDGYTTDKATVFCTTINELIYPIIGESVCVLVTGYMDSCTYLVQIVRKPVMKDNTSILMDRDISDLMDAINHPKMIAKYDHFKVCPAIGEVILAYHALSKMWMRVIVREYNYDRRWNLTDLEVYAADFGDYFKVKLKDTRTMLEDYMHVPFQVIPIYLDKYQHRIGCNARKAKMFWDRHISYKNFILHIKSSESPYKGNLTTYKGREIGPTLIKEGFAEKRSMDIMVAEGYKMNLD